MFKDIVESYGKLKFYISIDEEEIIAYNNKIVILNIKFVYVVF